MQTLFDSLSEANHGEGLPIHDPTFNYTIASWSADVKRVAAVLLQFFRLSGKEGLIFGRERGIVSTIQTKALEETRK